MEDINVVMFVLVGIVTYTILCLLLYLGFRLTKRVSSFKAMFSFNRGWDTGLFVTVMISWGLSIILFALACIKYIYPIEMDDKTLVLALLMIPLMVIFTLLQTLFEELCFRELFGHVFNIQKCRAKKARAFVMIVSSSVIFSLMHYTNPEIINSEYAFWPLLNIGVIGAYFAYLMLKYNGLEAPLAAHFINNILCFLFLRSELAEYPFLSFFMATGFADSYASTTISTILGIVFTQIGLFVLKKNRLQK